jgi:hypothetical protein
MMKFKPLVGAIIFSILPLFTVQCASSTPQVISRISDPHYGLIYYSQRTSNNFLGNIMAEGENEFGGIFLTDLATGKEKYLTEGSIISQYALSFGSGWQ